MKRYYILNDQGEPELFTGPVEDWLRLFRSDLGDPCKVASTKIGNIEISTVFLALDHNYRPGGPPILWETMVFGGPLDHYQRRCAGGREQAEAMHAEMVAAAQAASVPK